MRHRRNLNKKKAMGLHSKNRADLRYNISLNNKDLHNIVSLIKQGKALYLKSQSNRVSHLKVNYNGMIFRVVYDKNRHQVITFLPMEENPEA